MKNIPAVLCLCALAACGGDVKETLGLGRKAPDEFRIVSRPPLSVPPQFNLRPPSLTGTTPAGQSADRAAASLLLGAGENEPSGQGNTFLLAPGSAETAVAPVTAQPLGLQAETPAEMQFLQNAGAATADPRVRDMLVEERLNRQMTYEEEEESWWNFFGSDPASKEPLVHAKKESERIRQNEEEGKPITEGETPEVKSRDTGVLGKIFGY